MDEGQTLQLVISALGGALGALILRSSLKLAGVVRTRWSVLAEYDCGSPEPSGPGELRHCWGEQVFDEDATNQRAWKHNSKPIDRPGEKVTREHTIYGPYVNDFGGPGFYRVRFRLRGKDLPRTDAPVLSLDVVQARFGTQRVLRLLGQRIVRAKELSGKYQDFAIICRASGMGVYEYRVTVFPESGGSAGSEIRFDNIRVYAHPSIWEVF
jgi:hypothetical protein